LTVGAGVSGGPELTCWVECCDEEGWLCSLD